MPISGNMTAMSVAPTATVRNAANNGSMLSSARSICTTASSKNVDYSWLSVSSEWPERMPTFNMRAYSGSNTPNSLIA